MNAKTGLDRRTAAWLDDGPTQLSDRVLDAALREVHLTNQRRVRVPWRFSFMPQISRTTAVAAVVLLAVIGAGGFVYLNSLAGPGGPVTPTPSNAVPTSAPTSAPTGAPTSEPSFVAPGITGWTPYTSAVYGYTMAYPSDWHVINPAAHEWQPGEPALADNWPWADVFASADEEIGMWVWHVPAPAGADLNTLGGLQAALMEVCEVPTFGSCSMPNPPTPMCLGQQACRPALVLSMGITSEDTIYAVFGDPASRTITVFNIGRQDSFPASAPYGGTVALMKAILTQVDVWPPKPGQTPGA